MDGKLMPAPGAWKSDKYHISTDFLPAYEKAMVDYLKGMFYLHIFRTVVHEIEFSFSPIESIFLAPPALERNRERDDGETVGDRGGNVAGYYIKLSLPVFYQYLKQ